MNRHYSIIFILLFLVTACNQADFSQQTTLRLHAVFGQENSTKVELQEDLCSMFWSPEDHITVYTKSGESATFVSDNNEPSATTHFSGTLASYSSGDTLWARYPQANFGINNGIMEAELVPVQKAVKNGIDPNSYYCVARSNNEYFTFFNACGGFAFSVTHDDIVSAIFKTNNGETICGGFFISMDDDGIPSTEKAWWGNRDSALLYSTEGESFIPGAFYYFTLLPGQLAEGFTLILQNASGKVAEIPFNKPIDIKRSTYGRSREVDKNAVFMDPDVPDDYLIVQQILAETGQYYDDLRLSPQVTFDENNRAISLVLYGMGSGKLAKSIGALSELESLTLQGFKVIPEELSNCKKLKTLDISYSELGSLPSSLSTLDLESLHLIHCGLDAFPEFIYDIQSLRELDMSETNFHQNASLSSRLCDLTSLETLILHNCWLAGEFPENIGNLTALKHLDCANYNWFSNSIPASINNLTQLEYLDLSYAFQPISGQVFPDISALTNLRYLDLGGASLVGEIPESVGLLTNLEYLNWAVNYISGDIPVSVTKLAAWHRYGYKSIWQGPWGLEIYNTPSTLGLQFPHFSTADLLSGKQINDQSLLRSNELTLICTGLPAVYDDLKVLYDNYKDKGLGLLFVGSGDDFDARPILEAGFEQAFCVHSNNIDIEIVVGPVYYLFDKDGRFMGASPDSFSSVCDSIVAVLGDAELDIYESTDYSKDGMKKSLSCHQDGAGIHVVLLGDGFSDRLIADGTYDSMMQLASDALFSAEPYKSSKDLFDVDLIYAVSKHEQYVHGSETAFSCSIPQNSTLISGNYPKAIQYVETAYPDWDINKTLIIVVVNYPRYAGTCYMSLPAEEKGDYGNGSAVAFCTIDDKGASFTGTVLHEAGGHGFAKLADEYPGPGAITQDEISSYSASIAAGWYKNIDFTNDPATVKWHLFLEDDRYNNENLGCYEGGLVYLYGVWRPSSNSVMAYGYDSGFNAPSREAIWYRINKLAYGECWNGSYEDFVTFDTASRASIEATRAKVQSNQSHNHYPPLAPPVIVGRNWREAASEN